MRTTLAGCAALLLLIGVSMPADAAGVKVDQRCAPVKGSSGATSGLFSQSLTPTSKSTRRVDAILMSTTDQRVGVRMRIVGQRGVGSSTFQMNILAEQQVEVQTLAHRPAVFSMLFPTPLPWDGGALVSQFAVEVSLPRSDSSVVWLRCGPYAGGQAYQDSDAGDAAGRETQRGLLKPLNTDLAVTSYGA